MPDDSLVPLAPEIKTLARPIPAILLAARHEIRRNQDLQGLFQQAKAEHWNRDHFALVLTSGLERTLLGSPQEIDEASCYLVDEYLQFGGGMLLVSPTTGRAIYKVTDDDLWQPPEIVRENGQIIVPSPQLRPELQGYLVQWVFEEARDEKLLQEIRAALPTTDFLAECGDPRLKLITRVGRKSITDELREALPSLLVNGGTGVEGQFLSHLEVRSDDLTQDPDPQLRPILQSTAIARVRFGLQDVRTFNLKYDHTRMISHQIVTQWLSEIGRSLTLAAHQRGGRHILFRDLTPDDLLHGVCVLGPDEYRAIRDASWLETSRMKLFPVPGARSTRLRDKIGILALCPDGYELRSREIHGRWDILARCEYTLWINWSNVESFVLEEIPVVPIPAEFVR